MASGIVSVSLLMHQHRVLSWLLFGLAAGGYAVIWALTSVQLSRHRDRIAGFLAAPHTRFGYFTLVAATGVLATRLLLAGVEVVALAGLVIAGIAWIGIGVLVVRELRRDQLSWLRLVDGSWFLVSVAAHSVGILATGAAAALPAYSAPLSGLALTAWCIGIGCYLIILVGVIIRIARRGVTPQNLTAPYWITMGACAINVLDSSRIAVLLEQDGAGWISRAVAGGSIGFWLLATALLPIILIAGWWRHVLHHVPMDSTVLLWSIVFPLGMYDVASTIMGRAHQLPLARVIGNLGVWTALGAWAATLVLLLWRRWQGRRPLRRL